MTDTPWLGDACSLVDAFRSGERTPVEELDATLAAIERSELNAFSFLDPDTARDAAAHADTRAPFGGVPVGVKELDSVAGLAVYPGERAAEGLCGDARLHAGEPTPRHRRRARRAHDVERVRRREPHANEPQRRHAQPLGAQPYPGWVDGRRLVCGRGWSRDHQHGR